MGRATTRSILALLGSAGVLVAVTGRPAVADDCAAGGHDDAPRCSRFAGDNPRAVLSLDVAAVAGRVDVSERAAAEGMVAPGPRAARGGSFRFLTGLYGIYAGGEIVVLSLDSPERVLAHRGESPGALPGGAAVELRMIAGAMRSYGRGLLGAELGFGLRDVFRDAAASAEDRSSAQGLLDLRVTGGVWLTPHVSLALQLGTSLVRDEHASALVLGFAALPWNSTR